MKRITTVGFPTQKSFFTKMPRTGSWTLLGQKRPITILAEGPLSKLNPLAHQFEKTASKTDGAREALFSKPPGKGWTDLSLGSTYKSLPELSPEQTKTLSIVQHGGLMREDQITQTFIEVEKASGIKPSQVNLVGCKTADLAKKVSKKLPGTKVSGTNVNIANVPAKGKISTPDPKDKKSEDKVTGEVEGYGKVNVYPMGANEVSTFSDGREIHEAPSLHWDVDRGDE